jgi:hypothetical protein
MVTLWLITTGCSEKLPILYSPLKDDYQLSPGFTDREQGKNNMDEFFEDGTKTLQKYVPVDDRNRRCSGRSGRLKQKFRSYPEAHNGILEGLTATEWFTAGRQAAS